ncbi:hypothetical protein [Burkholderia ubonensis]|uniref:hypothetical protein n=1 Tax=Burkholderia ubonensis TaxID=101571 RepID=UPI000A98CDBC|nr:hypothetical protein [Burkholderia ubonensis]
MYTKLINAALMFCFFIYVNHANAQTNLTFDDISNGYSSCSWRDNGDGTSTLGLMIDYKTSDGHTGGYRFNSRGLLVYAYDKSGMVNISRPAAINAYMGGARNIRVYQGRSYYMYHGTSLVGTQWVKTSPFVANVEVVIDNSVVTAWPAISLQAGNFTNDDDIAEIKGAAYIARDGVNGTCTMVKDPTNPPPVPIAMNVTAPDWDLGELPRGDATKTFSRTADQLCFSYSGAAVSGKSFIIDASNRNGRTGNRYRLANVVDPTQTVNYRVTLNSGTSQLSLPNVGNIAAAFNSNGRTCFVPTFETSVDQRVEEGDYFDVLTFTVTTRS